MGVLVGIAAKPIRRGPMIVLSEGLITCESGLKEDCRNAKSRSQKRQVTVLSLEQWRETYTELGVSLPWHTRRANLCVLGIRFVSSDVGSLLTFSGRDGNRVCLEITGETSPCARMDDAYPGLKKALTPEWRGGVTCRVVHPGILHVGARVEKRAL